MDLLQLRYFRTVARLEHMTRAAQELYISQSSLSKTISHLEHELGLPLFDRQGRQIKLNQYGKTFLQRVEQAFAALENGQRELAELTNQEQRRISLASMSVYLLPNLLQAFLKNHTDISIRLFSNPRRETLAQLERGEVDLFISSPPIEVTTVEQTSLMMEEILLAVPQGHWLAERETINLSEVAGEAFLALKPGYRLRELTDTFCQQAGFTPHIVFEGDEPVALLHLVKAGIGIACIPSLVWKSFPEMAVRSLHITEPRCEREMLLLYSKEHYLSSAAREFRDFIITYFAQFNQKRPA
ncbi:LysR family transcriptional regulator [Ktedonosporobacter rubrisoli]|uniref:LysR family transcriptional regulator n=1 Tax=Ktedonosporobacter rubrisoli TaxID=2509675 RepID=A0A4P6JP51_KTERU|nr:LysR family transcriptional regulator [Ktedonosporobacter rubrisoli]QBD77128.1 LysR family transcriptional regulator [Ktedonosporobacter rubrisoli]